MDKTFLIHDPTIIGHHLIYAENFIDWALSRGFNVKFSSVDVSHTYMYKKFSAPKYRDRVEFIHFDIRGDNDLRFYRESGRRLQVRHILKLQKLFKPHITFLQYGDYMWPQWNRMLDINERFLNSTYMLLIRGNEAHYLGKETYYSKALKRQLKENPVFEIILTLDEYQVAADTNNNHLIYLPDPFMPHKREVQPFTEHEETTARRIREFMRSTGRKPILLFVGAVVSRKNIHWLIEAALKNPQYCYMQLGPRYGTIAGGQETQDNINRLKEQQRYFEIDEFLQHHLLEIVLKSQRVKFLLLPYDIHYGSSAIQLMAFKYRKPVLVPEHGLMGRRVKDNGLGLAFKNGCKEDFFAQMDNLMKQAPSSYTSNILTFMEGFSRKALYHHLNNIFDQK